MPDQIQVWVLTEDRNVFNELREAYARANGYPKVTTWEMFHVLAETVLKPWIEKLNSESPIHDHEAAT